MVYSIHSPWTHKPQPDSGVHPNPAETVAIANSGACVYVWCVEGRCVCGLCARDSLCLCDSVARTTNDITPAWETILDRAHTNDAFANLSQPGYFNDPDMLEIGNGALTDAEGRSQLALWSIMRAPLLSVCSANLLPRREPRVRERETEISDKTMSCWNVAGHGRLSCYS